MTDDSYDDSYWGGHKLFLSEQIQTAEEAAIGPPYTNTFCTCGWRSEDDRNGPKEPLKAWKAHVDKDFELYMKVMQDDFEREFGTTGEDHESNEAT